MLEHEPGDLTAIVEAGIRLSELQARLAPHGQMLALDPPGDPTIGACLAGDLSGPRRHRYGAMRDLVIGVTLVLADGTIASSGGKVVKNVAGYDLGKLFSGSRGRLGLIARVALRLHPRPAAEATVVAETDDPRALWQELQRSQLDAERRRLPAAGPRRAALRGRRGRGRGPGRAPARVAPADPSVWDESAARQREAGGPRAVRLAGLPARAARRRARLRGRAGRPRVVAARRARPRVVRSRRRALLMDPKLISRLRALRLLPADAARPTSSGTRRWTRRAAGSG